MLLLPLNPALMMIQNANSGKKGTDASQQQEMFQKQEVWRDALLLMSAGQCDRKGP